MNSVWACAWKTCSKTITPSGTTSPRDCQRRRKNSVIPHLGRALRLLEVKGWKPDVLQRLTSINPNIDTPTGRFAYRRCRL